MEDNTGFTPKQERKGLALASLIIALVALLCAFIVHWRIFALVCSGVAIVVSIISVRKAVRSGSPVKMQVAALIIAFLAIPVAAYFLYNATPVDSPKPNETLINRPKGA
jgi:lysylphosphatidylglycerol synthetase-like protein (DUF2156 family)